MADSASQLDSARLLRRLAWTLAALELCLDMERNESDNKFDKSSEDAEIVYTFDEDIFEMFVGGFDETRDEVTATELIYHDRRRSVGIFNTYEWREKLINDLDERARIHINRQSAIMTSEWLFSGKLPGMKDGKIYISRQHLMELGHRWEDLIYFYRDRFDRGRGYQDERKQIEGLAEDLPARVLRSDLPPGAKRTEAYIVEQPEPLRDDLAALWTAMSRQQGRRSGHDARSREMGFWRYSFNRHLADILARLRITEPIGQLIRINGQISGRLTLLHTVMDLDRPERLPLSETASFWEERLEEEAKSRLTEDRKPASVKNDGQSLALVQALANSTERQGLSHRYRFVFVTSDSLVIDAYRKWHCNKAEPYEPFVLRRVRQYAPLLNIKNMAPDDTDEEKAAKSDIFPRLKKAIEPFLLSINVAAPQAPVSLGKQGKASGRYGAHEDSVRWSREQFAIRLSAILSRFKKRVEDGEHVPVNQIKKSVADTSIFTNGPYVTLEQVDVELGNIASLGRRIERSVIGFGSPWLTARLAGLRPVQETQRRMADGDDTALTTYVRSMVQELGQANLDLRISILNISSELQKALSGMDAKAVSGRVPLALKLTYEEQGTSRTITDEASRMIGAAMRRTDDPRGKLSDEAALDRNWSATDIGQDDGYRLFALYCCMALHLSQWDVAYRCAIEAQNRGGSRPVEERRELDYLVALSTRFRIGAGAIFDANRTDVTEQEYEIAELILKSNMKSTYPEFTQLRAASELASLKLFGCAWALCHLWSATGAGTFPNVFTAAFHQTHLREAIDLLLHLHEQLTSPGLRHSQFDELRQKVAINVAAASCFCKITPYSEAEAGPGIGGELGRLRHVHEWLDPIARKGGFPDAWRPTIASLFFSWYLYLRGIGSEPRQADYDPSMVTVDRRIAALVRTKLPGAKGTIQIS